jgi:uncharacterized membrane protein YagU involved in acid resistance
MPTARTIVHDDELGLAQKGVLAGLAGGLIFGALMAMQGMLPMVGMLVGRDSTVIGFMVHMVISSLAGVIFGVLAVRLTSSWGLALVSGLVYGVIWWVVGALILMPLMLGMPEMVLQIGRMQWMSLIGHLAFGLVLAVVFVLLLKRN